MTRDSNRLIAGLVVALVLAAAGTVAWVAVGLVRGTRDGDGERAAAAAAGPDRLETPAPAGGETGGRVGSGAASSGAAGLDEMSETPHAPTPTSGGSPNGTSSMAGNDPVAAPSGGTWSFGLGPRPGEDLHVDGWVRDEHGAALSGAKVVAFVPMDEPGDFLLKNAESDETGRFRLGPLAAGFYRMEIEAEGYVTVELGPVEAGSSEVIAVLRHGAAIHGRVRAADGASLAGVELALRRVLGSGSVYNHGRPWHMDGRFRFTGLPPGRYSLAAHAPGYVDAAIDTDVPETGDVGPLDLVLGRGGVVTGRVMDGQGDPLAEVEVTWIESDRASWHGFGWNSEMFKTAPTSDADGRFLVTAVRPGTGSLKLIHPRYRPARVDDVEVAEDRVTHLGDVVLADGGRIAGTVRDGKAVAVEGAVVEVLRSDGREDRRETETDAEGRFEVPGLPAGDYWVMVTGLTEDERRPGGLPVVATTAVAEGATALVDLRVKDGVRVEGRVLLRGRPVPTATVRIIVMHSPVAGGDAGMRPEEDGSFVLPGLSAGEYHLTVALDGSVDIYSFGLWVAEGQDLVRVDLDPPLGSVHGRVALPDGTLASGAEVELEADREAEGLAPYYYVPYRVRTDAGGRFRFPWVLPGRYRVRVAVPGYTWPDGTVIDVEAALEPGPLDLVVSRGGRLIGRVVDGAGLPLPGVRIVRAGKPVFDAWSLRQAGASTRADGGWALEGLPAGRCFVILWKEGMGERRIGPLEAPADGTLDLGELVIGPTGRLRAAVLDNDGRPAAGVKLLAWPDAEAVTCPAYASDALFDYPRATVSGEDGMARWPALAPGAWTVYRADGEGRMRASAAVMIAPDAEVTVHVAGRE